MLRALEWCGDHAASRYCWDVEEKTCQLMCLGLYGSSGARHGADRIALRSVCLKAGTLCGVTRGAGFGGKFDHSVTGTIIAEEVRFISRWKMPPANLQDISRAYPGALGSDGSWLTRWAGVSFIETVCTPSTDHRTPKACIFRPEAFVSSVISRLRNVWVSFEGRRNCWGYLPSR